MSDVVLTRPLQDQRIVFSNLPGNARLVLDFPTEEVALGRADDDLIFAFNDQTSIVIEKFYATFTSETSPAFVVEGDAVSSAPMLFSDSLADTCDPPHVLLSSGSHFQEYADSALISGIDRLDGVTQTAPAKDGMFAELFVDGTTQPGMVIETDVQTEANVVADTTVHFQYQPVSELLSVNDMTVLVQQALLSNGQG